MLGDVSTQSTQAMLPGIRNRLRGCQRNRSFILSLFLWSFSGFLGVGAVTVARRSRRGRGATTQTGLSTAERR
ncbi:MAG: hypothetical protein VW842_08260, partial [Halieaceae bacterium]